MNTKVSDSSVLVHGENHEASFKKIAFEEGSSSALTNPISRLTGGFGLSSQPSDNRPSNSFADATEGTVALAASGASLSHASAATATSMGGSIAGGAGGAGAGDNAVSSSANASDSVATGVKGGSSLLGRLFSGNFSGEKVTVVGQNRHLEKKLLILTLLVLAACGFYLFGYINYKFFDYAMSIRIPKLSAMVVAAICIGGSSLIFQTLINNNIVTPCLLGMNSLYLVLHTVLVFAFGMGSFIITNKNLAFICDLALMGAVAGFVYNYLFTKTRYNVLYVLLIGTVMTTFFTSIQTTIVRTMDPNDYDALLLTLVASFSNVNSEVIILSIVLCVALTFFFRKELKLLNVISLGRENAISLGVDYERTLKYMLLYVTLLIAIATALVGPISFMGLITTNLARQLFKTYKHSYLISGAVLITVLILIAGQALIERVFVYSVPIAIFITIGGGLYFLYLVLLSTKKSI